MKRSSLVTPFFIGAALWTGVQALAQNTDPDHITVTWSDPSRPGLLKISLLSGGINVRTHSGPDVIIDAKSGRGRRRVPAESGGLRRIDLGANDLVVEESDNVMSVSTSIFRDVDLEIQVPSKTNLNLKTINGGGIVVENVEGEIEVTNLNGAVTLNNVAGSVVAHSMNGRVIASLRQVAEKKPMAFTSMNGNIDVTLPPSVKANLKMRTNNGGVYSDFDISPSNSPPTIEDSRNRGGRYRVRLDNSMVGTINSGGPDFDLRTFNGNIYIRKAKQ
jgi:DUF4097 and DUF4098 domain-containing protein YvlB